LPLFIKKDIPTYHTFKDIPFVLKVVRKIAKKTGIPSYIWYDDWTKEIKEINTIIYFCDNSFEYLKCFKYIKRNNPQTRIIFWYWNPVFKMRIKPTDIPDHLCEIWSFDEKDCKQYGLRSNTTFYFDTIKLPLNEVIYDVMFVGVDKGRKEALSSFKAEMEKVGINSYFYIVDDDWNKKNYKGPFKPIDYEEYLALVSKSKAILDYVQEGQHGLTLRPMESVFFQKKLITNDKSIINNDFYNSNNIFILGVDDIRNLKTFLSTPYSSIPLEIKEKYDAKTWLNRFLIEDNNNK
jgi:hypothetical protein